MAETRRLAVVGGDAAGMSAAAQAKRRDPELDVVVYERGAWSSYSACGIPFHLTGEVDPIDALVARSPQEHRANGLDLRMGCEVIAVDLDARRITYRDDGAQAGRERVEPFDELLVATGAAATPPPIPGADAVDPIRTLEAAGRLRGELEARRDDDVCAVVVGGGYIGVELAEALVVRGVPTTLVEAGPQLMALLDPELAEHVRLAAEGKGIDVRLETGVEEILLDHAGRSRAVRLSGGEEVRAEHVVLATGVKAEVAVAQAAGLVVGPTGALACEDTQRACGHDGVWVAGDCAEAHHLLLDAPVNLQLGTHANKQGRVAGMNMTGGDERFPGVIGTAITRICALEVARTGLGEVEARAAGFDVAAETVRTSTRAGYMPDSEDMWVKLVAEKGTGRLLGAQIVGGATAGKRIDPLALAVWVAMDVQQLEWVDLSYAPPFSRTLDPVLTAARAVAKLV